MNIPSNQTPWSLRTRNGATQIPTNKKHHIRHLFIDKKFAKKK